jgi:hypothetical protein
VRDPQSPSHITRHLPLLQVRDALSERKHGAIRSVTVSTRVSKALLEHERAAADEAWEGLDAERPRTRGDCLPGGCNEARPCPWVSCKHHVYLDVTRGGALKLNHPRLEVWELRDTCALDVADREDATLEEVGGALGLTRERVRQMEHRGVARLRLAAEEAELWDDE